MKRRESGEGKHVFLTRKERSFVEIRAFLKNYQKNMKKKRAVGKVFAY